MFISIHIVITSQPNMMLLPDTCGKNTYFGRMAPEYGYKVIAEKCQSRSPL
jgi:hypothetical protein